MAESNSNEALSIILRAFQLTFDNTLKLHGKEPIIEKLKPEEVAALFKFTAKSEKNRVIALIRSLNRSVVPRYPECGKMAYKQAAQLAFNYAQYYKACFV